jgi:hypothetical protein
MAKFNQAHHDLLRAAAGKDDGSIMAPDDRKTFVALIKKGLMISVPQAEGASHLLITDAGRETIRKHGVASPPDDQSDPARPPEAAPRRTPKGKIGAVVTMVRRPEGATIEALMVATGWQAHSVRGALSGAVKKGLGLNVASEKVDGVRSYRIVDEAAA